MDELVRKTLLAGAALGLFAKEALEKGIRRLSEESDISEEDARTFAEELKADAAKAWESIDDDLLDQVNKAVESIGSAAREGLKDLDKKLDEMLKEREQ